MQVLSVGEVLWDVIGEREFLGGAPLNFSVGVERLGNSVALVSAVAQDARGELALARMAQLGLPTSFVQTVSERPTGTAVVVSGEAGNATYRIDRPAAFDCLHISAVLLDGLAALKPDWIYFGTLAQTNEPTERMLRALIERAEGARRFYDLNLRVGHWNLELVERLSSLASVLKLNDDEAELLFRLTFPNKTFDLETFCRHWSETYGMNTICVTQGSKGCAIFAQGKLRSFAGIKVNVADTVGAGDAFAAGFLHGFHLGWPLERIAAFANALGGLVASRSGATPPWTIEECLDLMGKG